MNRNLRKKIETYDMSASSISYYDLQNNYNCTYRTYDRVKILAVLSGEINYAFNDISVTQGNTEFMILPGYSTPGIHVIKPTRLMIMEFDNSLVKAVFKNLRNKVSFSDAINTPRLFVKEKYTDMIYKAIQEIHSGYTENKDDPYLVELSIRKLIYTLMKTDCAAYLFSIQARHPMEQATYYIERNIYNPIKINDIAGLLNMSGPNFTNTFKRHYGVSPNIYIRSCKMDLAKKILMDNSVTDTALDLGYESISAFISHFKSTHGITPKQFQLSNA